jgi:hypothetical protein
MCKIPTKIFSCLLQPRKKLWLNWLTDGICCLYIPAYRAGHPRVRSVACLSLPTELDTQGWALLLVYPCLQNWTPTGGICCLFIPAYRAGHPPAGSVAWFSLRKELDTHWWDLLHVYPYLEMDIHERNLLLVLYIPACRVGPVDTHGWDLLHLHPCLQKWTPTDGISACIFLPTELDTCVWDLLLVYPCLVYFILCTFTGSRDSGPSIIHPSLPPP